MTRQTIEALLTEFKRHNGRGSLNAANDTLAEIVEALLDLVEPKDTVKAEAGPLETYFATTLEIAPVAEEVAFAVEAVEEKVTETLAETDSVTVHTDLGEINVEVTQEVEAPGIDVNAEVAPAILSLTEDEGATVTDVTPKTTRKKK
jgi:hypothetical protein